MKGYKITVACYNCGYKETITIGRGVRYTEVPCNNCGCFDLYKTTSMEVKMAEIYKD